MTASTGSFRPKADTSVYLFFWIASKREPYNRSSLSSSVILFISFESFSNSCTVGGGLQLKSSLCICSGPSSSRAQTLWTYKFLSSDAFQERLSQFKSLSNAAHWPSLSLASFSMRLRSFPAFCLFVSVNASFIEKLHRDFIVILKTYSRCPCRTTKTPSAACTLLSSGRLKKIIFDFIYSFRPFNLPCQLLSHPESWHSFSRSKGQQPAKSGSSYCYFQSSKYSEFI